MNPDGNRQLNHALYVAALGQISLNTAGRELYLANKPKATAAKKHYAR